MYHLIEMFRYVCDPDWRHSLIYSVFSKAGSRTGQIFGALNLSYNVNDQPASVGKTLIS